MIVILIGAILAIAFFWRAICLQEDGFVPCRTCGGKGYTDTSTEDYDLDVPMMMVKCKSCNGIGEIYVPTHQEMG